MELLDEIHLERAANTAILQRYQALVLLTYHPALLDQFRIDIYLADIIDNNGKSNPLFV